MPPILSICIPTYNRCRYLPETLDSILAQATSDVEIVISDNASMDATQDVVAEYSAMHPNIHYSRADTNLGPDANFLRVVSLATGTYCWLLSDDDTVQPGAISTILKELQEGYEIYTFNETSCGNNLEPIREQQRLSAPDGRVVYELSNTSDLSLFFERSDPVGGIPFGLISVLVFKKEIWEKVVIPEEILGTAYVHVYVLIATKDYGARLKYLPQSLVMNRLNESYISTDPIRNFWVTADGYMTLRDKLFTPLKEEKTRNAFFSITRRIFSVKQQVLLRFCCRTISEWNPIEARLMIFGYNYLQLKIIRLTYIPLLMMRTLWRTQRNLFNIIKERLLK